jgi:hypothetical protein
MNFDCLENFESHKPSGKFIILQYLHNIILLKEAASI